MLLSLLINLLFSLHFKFYSGVSLLISLSLKIFIFFLGQGREIKG